MPNEHTTRHRNPRGTRSRAYLGLLLLLILALVWPHRTRSQTATPTTTPQPLPQSAVYQQVFQHVVFLDYQADIADQKGQNGNALRNYYQNHATLTSTEAALLHSTSHDAVTAIVAVNQQIQAEVALFRSQFAGVKLPHGKPLPAPPPQLRTLQATKDNIIMSHLSSIQTGFGTGRFQHLDNFVQSQVAPHITLTTVLKPAAKTADQGKTLPLLPPLPWMK